MNTNVFWLSRHDLTPIQIEDLNRLADKHNYGVFVPHKRNVTWQATADEAHDREVNREVWAILHLQSLQLWGHSSGIYLGVFPPAAIEALTYSPLRTATSDPLPASVQLWSPVSRQSSSVRNTDGATAPVVFEHVRWARQHVNVNFNFK